MFFLRLCFHEEGHLHSKCLFNILTIYHKSHILHFFSLFALNAFLFSVLKLWHTYAHSNPNRCSKWAHKSPKKKSYFVKKTFFFLRFFFRDEGDLYANSLFDVLTIYPKCYLLQFFSRGIRKHIPILTGFQNGRMNLRKKSCFAKKYFFLKFIF